MVAFHLQGTNEQVPQFFIKDGKTFSVTKSKVRELADFCLKLLGELREGPNEDRRKNKEGTRIVSLTGYVFSHQQTWYNKPMIP